MPLLRVASFNFAHRQMDQQATIVNNGLVPRVAFANRLPLIAARITSAQASLIGLQENSFGELGEIAPLCPRYQWLDLHNPIGWDPTVLTLIDSGTIEGVGTAFDGNDLPWNYARFDHAVAGQILFGSYQFPAYNTIEGATARAAAARNLVSAINTVNPEHLPTIVVADTNSRWGENRAVYRDAEATLRAAGLQSSRLTGTVLSDPVTLSSLNGFGQDINGKFWYGVHSTDEATTYDRIYCANGARGTNVEVQPGPVKPSRINRVYYTAASGGEPSGDLASDHNLVVSDITLP